MKIIAVDDEKLALESLVSSIHKVDDNYDVKSFSDGDDAIKYVGEDDCDIAFLDIEMRGIDGITLAKRLKAINPRINIIFTTGYSEYTGKAFELHASGYVMKPVTPQKIKDELEVLRYGIEPKSSSKINVKTFGNFEVYADGKPLEFKYNKSKEMFAYLVDRRGALCSNNEIMCALWEDDCHTSYFKNSRADMLAVMENSGYADVIVRQWGKLGIDADKIECDYYNWIDGELSAINAYRGEYMSQYSWSEFTHGTLEEKI